MYLYSEDSAANSSCDLMGNPGLLLFGQQNYTLYSIEIATPRDMHVLAIQASTGRGYLPPCRMCDTNFDNNVKDEIEASQLIKLIQ